MSDTDWQLHKRPTGLAGLDQLTRGGLPASQTTLVVGGSGTGKTVLTLQILAHAVERGDGGVFVTFEESPAQVRRNADSFRWGVTLNESDAWTVMDARPQPGTEMSGEFDIEGLLAAINAAADRCRDPWVVIDGIDQLLQRQPERSVAVDQVRQINERCEAHGWTVLLSGKLDGDGLAPRNLEGVEFMLPTTIVLSATMQEGRLNRQLRVAKYRGSGHVSDEMPLIMSDEGIHLPYHAVVPDSPVPASEERVSTGVARLDDLLAGGPYRGSSTLISGRPGTAKSTLAAGFAEAAAERGDRALYVSFDEREAPYVRNLASVGIDLRPHIEAGRIRFCGLSAWSSLLAEHFLTLQHLIDEFEPACLVIDPVSALMKAIGTEGARAATERILEVTQRRGITTIMTSLTGVDDAEGEFTLAQVSTIADTWIVLDHNVRGGERNRSLSIVKSRGSAHSNQQRELLLSSKGVDLADVYEFGTEVLMGTARVQKESEERAAARRRELQRSQRHQDLLRRIEQARSEVERLEDEFRLEETEAEELDRLAREYAEHMQRRRGGDNPATGNTARDGEDHDRKGNDE